MAFLEGLVEFGQAMFRVIYVTVESVQWMKVIDSDLY